jgi:hypothetical protein
MGQLRWPFFAAGGCSQIPPGVPANPSVALVFSQSLATKRRRLFALVPDTAVCCRQSHPRSRCFPWEGSARRDQAAASRSPIRVTDHHAPCGASVGLTFVFAELSGLDALARAPAAGPAAQGSKRAGAARAPKKTPRRSLWGSPGREFRSAKDPASHRSGARGPRIGFAFGYRLLAGEGDLLVGLQVSSTTLGGAAVP